MGAPRTKSLPRGVRDFVEKQRLGFVATINPDGSPNVSPKGTVTVWDEASLVFADLASPGTVRNLARDPRVAVNVVDPVSRKGWRFAGVADLHRQGVQFEEGVRHFGRLNLPGAPKRIRTIVFVRVESLAPLVSPAYTTGLSELQVRNRAWRRLQELNADLRAQS
jgi:uncharacterized protein